MAQIIINLEPYYKINFDWIYLGMAHTNLESYFKINFALIQHHKYSLTEIENMMPWEREVYLTLLQQYIEEENLKTQQQSGI